MICCFPTLWKWWPSIGEKSEEHFKNISSPYLGGYLIKFNNIALNNQLNLDTTHCIVFFWLRLAPYHKIPSFKNCLKSHQYTGEDIETSLWA